MKRTVLVLALVAGVLGIASPARATTPAVWAFGAVLNPTPVGTETLPAQYRGNSLCPDKDATVRETAVGVYVVTFPCVASHNGIVHVTAIDGTGRICTPAKWSAGAGTEVVTVFCYGTNGVPTTAYPADAMFAVLYTTSDGVGVTSGGWYSYVSVTATGALSVSYNSTGATNTVTHLGTGAYQVHVVNRGAGKVSGNIQVNAIDPNHTARQCQVAAWSPGDSDNLVTVHCYDFDGRPVDSPFVFAYHNQRALTGAIDLPKHFGYLWSGYGGPPNVSYNSVGSTNGVSYDTVYFGGIGVGATDLQVTAFGANPMVCQPGQLWESGTTIIEKTVHCTAPPKYPVNPYYFITANGDT
jgi:hypothetical protein